MLASDSHGHGPVAESRLGAINVRTEMDAVVLIYRARSFLTPGWKPIEQRVPITWTPCHLGGQRPWFICSARPKRPPLPGWASALIPVVCSQSVFARDGGLLSYGVDQVDPLRRAASYIDRILLGAKPGELPVQLPTKFEVVVNLKTAKALGLTVPRTLLAIADEVIE
jgi:hypothetical protein